MYTYAYMLKRLHTKNKMPMSRFEMIFIQYACQIYVTGDLKTSEIPSLFLSPMMI